jgi:type IV pilus assembly protein PilM
MAKNVAVWGIDIGQCSLKALKCRAHDQDDMMIVAEAFDYIEYPKILSQPGSDPAELIGDALRQFLSRNSVKGDRVAISVPGQAGLARFIKLPPVESKKIPEIVRYEAKQQIPFDLNDVIWRYQRMGGGAEQEGFALETEVGLFAMKRDAVARALDPFQRVGIEVDIVQLTPLALYNFVLFDQMGEVSLDEEYDPENPPDSVAVISLGTDATDLVITNGYRVWQRSVPMGGNHFTKALTKELKLTFAKAEHLKRNISTAEDPKAVFHGMRQVFRDVGSEFQRSIGFFHNIDRSAKISRVVALGNAVKLMGLERFLTDTLDLKHNGKQIKIERFDSFNRLVGPQVLTAPAFKDNILCFGSCYGLVIQGLEKMGLLTNLLPDQIMQERAIRRKKPWGVAAAAVLLLGCTLSYMKGYASLGSMNVSDWADAGVESVKVKKEADDLRAKAAQAEKEYKSWANLGERLTGNAVERERWLRLSKMINECLRIDPPAGKQPPKEGAKLSDIPLAQREELHIDSMDCRYEQDLGQWFAKVKQWSEDASGAPAGPGWVVTLNGHHFHNSLEQDPHVAAQYVRENLIENLKNREIELPDPEKQGELAKVSAKILGIDCPVLVDPKGTYDAYIEDPNAAVAADISLGLGSPKPAAKPGLAGAPGPGDAAAKPATAAEPKTKKCFNFVVEFCWTKGPRMSATAIALQTPTP